MKWGTRERLKLIPQFHSFLRTRQVSLGIWPTFYCKCVVNRNICITRFIGLLWNSCQYVALLDKHHCTIKRRQHNLIKMTLSANMILTSGLLHNFLCYHFLCNDEIKYELPQTVKPGLRMRMKLESWYRSGCSRAQMGMWCAWKLTEGRSDLNFELFRTSIQ